MQPETRYAKSGDVHIAYQVLGDGPIDVVGVPGFASHLEYVWEEPAIAAMFRRFASFCRLIRFDKRGTGLSDRVTASELPTLEQRMDDVRAVMDAVGSERAALVGFWEGGPMCTLFAATYPQRTRALVLYGTMARFTAARDYPWAPSEEEHERLIDELESGWGQGKVLARLAPSLAEDERARDWFARMERLAASPGAAVALWRMNTTIDVRHVLPMIRVPTLVLHRRHDVVVPVESGRYVAQHIPGARFVELPGRDHAPWVGDMTAYGRDPRIPHGRP